MTRLLYVEASPRKQNSYSSRVAQAFLESYQETHPDHDVEQFPLFQVDLPPFTAEGADQKMENIMNRFAGGDGIEAIGEWAGVMAEIGRLERADKVLLSSPVWNYSLPYRLKHWLDLVVQVGVTVLVNEKFEYIGQLIGRRVQIITSSGSSYEERFPLPTDGTKTDFMHPYLEHIFRFLGFEDIRTLRVHPTGIPGPDLEKMVAEKEEEARAAAKTF